MKPVILPLSITCTALAILPAVGGDEWPPAWSKALPGWEYQFPRDHASHPEFKSEWWYFTGNLAARDGRRFGYELVFFRQGVRPPEAGRENGKRPRLQTDSIKLAHFAIADPARGGFHFGQRTSRGAFGEAGFGELSDSTTTLAWIDSWQCQWDERAQHFLIRAQEREFAIEATLRPQKPPVLHGKYGVSQKAEGAGNASHYYSFTRMHAQATLTVDGVAHQAEGLGWFDHEWSTSQLSESQTGWDWFSIQFDDGTELMLYQLRMKTGGIDPHSHGTFVNTNGDTLHIASDQYSMQPLKFWTSPETGATYPVTWRIHIENPDMELAVTTPLDAQELVLDPISYWEGMIEAEGTRDKHPVHGRGYLEMTGYASGIPALQ